MDWKHGYFAEAGYTYGYYDETMPVRLHLAALLQGYLAPRNHFRYLDAGCGQGYNLIVAAACHPECEFVGIDFMPEHIAHARALASRMGLHNVQFIEGDFIELSQQPQALGSFDYVVCHGITTWIAPAVRTALFKLVGACLKPGGIFYNSYNTFPGWLGVSPFQHLVALNQRHMGGQEALNAAADAMRELNQHSPRMTKALPALVGRLESMAKQDPAYLVQEYNNQFWQPVYVSQMMEELAAVKLSYAGTATVPEIGDSALPQPVRDLLAKQKDITQREQLVDYAVNQSFRRDLYIKGRVKPWAGQLKTARSALRFVFNPHGEVVPEDKPFVFKGGAVEVSRQSAAYNRLLKQIADAPAGLGFDEIHALWPDIPQAATLLNSLALLVHSRHVFIDNMQPPTGSEYTKPLLNALCALAIEGAPYKVAPAAKLGVAMPMSEAKWSMLRCHLWGLPQNQWHTEVAADIAAQGKNFMKDGKVTNDPEHIRELLKAAIDDFASKQLPLMI